MTRRKVGIAAVACAAAAVAIALSWYAAARAPRTSEEPLSAALRGRIDHAAAHAALADVVRGADPERALTTAILAVGPKDANRLASALMSWDRWNGATAAALGAALDSEEIALAAAAGSPTQRERWRNACTALHTAETVGRLRGGATVVSLVDAAKPREGGARADGRIQEALQIAAASVHAGVAPEMITSGGEALLQRADAEDRAAGAELVRLSANRIRDLGRRREAVENLLAAAGVETSRRTMFFLTDGLRAVDRGFGPDDATLTVSRLRPVYEAPGTRWRASCLGAIPPLERSGELRRFANSLSSGAIDDDAVAMAHTVLTLGDPDLRIETLRRWAQCSGAREPEAYTGRAFRVLWERADTRQLLLARLLAVISGAAERRDPAPELCRLLTENSASFREDPSVRRDVARAETAWVEALAGEAFWRALLAWALAVGHDDIESALRRFVASTSDASRRRLDVLFDAPPAQRAHRVDAILAATSGAQAEWWRHVAERLRSGRIAL